MLSDPSTLTPAALLARAEQLVTTGRRVEVEKLETLLALADVFSGDPQAEPGAVPVKRGGPKLITLGGEGAPGVSDLALVEIAVARHEGVAATRRAVADALDLRHRLPRTWAATRALRCEVWVARRVATMSRRLTREQAMVVDVAVAAAADQAPNRIIAIAEAKVIEADQKAHQERVERNQRRNGVWFSRPKAGDQVDDNDQTSMAGIGTMFARMDDGDVAGLEQFVEDLAIALMEDAGPDQQHLTLDHWRAEALAMMADPAAVLAFLKGLEHKPAGETPAEVVVHVALTEDGSFGPVARVEHLGPRILAQVKSLLAGHTNVTVTPVIDLHEGRSVNGYEHPTHVKRRTELRTLGDVFPHAAGLFGTAKRSPDHDHTVAYDKDGPPGQTGDHNDTPLSRLHHRAKTHHGYSVFQLGPDRWLWGTPHGLYRLVTGGGTRPLTAAEYAVGRLIVAPTLAA